MTWRALSIGPYVTDAAAKINAAETRRCEVGDWYRVKHGDGPWGEDGVPSASECASAPEGRHGHAAVAAGAADLVVIGAGVQQMYIFHLNFNPFKHLSSDFCRLSLKPLELSYFESQRHSNMPKISWKST